MVKYYTLASWMVPNHGRIPRKPDAHCCRYQQSKKNHIKIYIQPPLFSRLDMEFSSLDMEFSRLDMEFSRLDMEKS